MPSEITRARVTSCCSLVIRISATSRSLFNAGSDWVGSCAITIKRRRDPTPKGSIPKLRYCAMRLGNRGSRGSRFATRRPNSASGKLDRPVKYRFFHRCDILAIRDRHDEGPGILGRIRQGEVIEHYDTVRRRKDGALVDISLSVSPLKDGFGRVIGVSKIARDITETKLAQARQDLLTQEIYHRTRNLFA